MQTVENRIIETIEAPLEHMGYRLVQVKLGEGSKRRVLRILAERASDGMMNVDDCTQVSRTVSTLLDVEDPIKGAYDLEVSSPGIDRPLVKESDFETYLGFEAKIETSLPITGRRRFKGPLMALENGEVFIEVDKEQYAINLDNIAQAQLVLTDELIKAQAAKRKAATQQN